MASMTLSCFMLTKQIKCQTLNSMPTDGADFGRSKACYGKAYTAARMGVEDSQVAEIIVCGVERDIRRDGGSPVFSPAVDLLVLVSQPAQTNSWSGWTL
jgi:hypothetical protein